MEFLFIAGFFFMIAAIFDTLTFDEKKAKKGKLKKPQIVLQNLLSV